jgi:prolyl-tRNA synthetase
MKHTQIFTKTKKEVPSDEVAKNAQLLIKAGFVYKEMAGVYAYLPMGLKTLEKIKQIAREEMNKISGNEIIMTALQRKELWEKTDRWSDKNVDVWFKSFLKNGTEVGFGWSHEEPMTDMVKQNAISYKDYPIKIYQFQTKLRNEIRSKSGIMRGREFVMKDLYAYHTNEEDHNNFYESVKVAYIEFFKRVGLGEDTFITGASGGAFTKKMSHEFQTICDAGEDYVYVDLEKRIAINEEILEDKENLIKLDLSEEKLTKLKTIETGNIFDFGTTKCEELGLLFTDKDGTKKPIFLSSYGIGITRVMGVIVEKYGDEKGLVWPKNVAPYEIEIVSLHKEENDKVYDTAERIHLDIKETFETLWDDRLLSPGNKLADADLYGCPVQIIIGEKSLAEGMVEIKQRKTGEIAKIETTLVLNYLNHIWPNVF